MPPRKHHVPFNQARIAALFGRYSGLGPRLSRWESAALREELDGVRPGSPVWICGMARSGSTVLLEMLNGLPEFTSHRYSDYPWLWTPYWWNRLHARLPLPAVARQERAHRDRIEVNRDSPEAFEEVFWMHYFPGRHDPAINQVIDADADATAFARFFDEHQRKLLAVRGATRYLAKANDHLPRLGLLRRLYPQARFIIPVRNPLDQVASLCKQDALFSRLDSEDSAVSAHLARIGHFEFGPHKRALNLGDETETQAIAACFERGDMAEGYARQWVVQYGHALQRMRSDPELANACLWVSHDLLCESPETEIDRISSHLNLDAGGRQFLASEWQHRLGKPAYYQPEFSQAETELIERIAGGMWRELQPLAV